MYAAIINEKLVYASQYYQKSGDILKCPKCLKNVKFILSKQKKPYFRHITSVKQNKESKEHYELKNQLFRELQSLKVNVFLERSVLNHQLQADILIQHKNKVVALEIQCSKLSYAVHLHRHQLYQSAEITDIWLLGQKLHLTNRLTKSHIQFMRYQKNLGFYLIELHHKIQKIKVKYNILREDLTSKAYYQQISFKLNPSGLKQLIKFLQTNQKLIQYPNLNFKKYYYKKQIERIKRLAYANRHDYYQLMERCYVSYQQPYFLFSETFARIYSKLNLSFEFKILLPVSLSHLNQDNIKAKKRRQLQNLLLI